MPLTDEETELLKSLMARHEEPSADEQDEAAKIAARIMPDKINKPASVFEPDNEVVKPAEKQRPTGTKTFSEWQDYRRTNKGQYYTSKVQKKMFADRDALGDSFYEKGK